MVLYIDVIFIFAGELLVFADTINRCCGYMYLRGLLVLLRKEKKSK